MRHTHRRSPHLPLSLATLLILCTACDPSVEGNHGEGEDMNPTPDMARPDLGVDMPSGDMPAEPLDMPDLDRPDLSEPLVFQGARLVSDPLIVASDEVAPIATLELEGEGAFANVDASVFLDFEDDDKDTLITLSTSEKRLSFSPPVHADYRGPVKISVTIADTTHQVDRPLLYGNALLESLGEPALDVLPGVGRIDAALGLDADRLLVLQEASPSPNAIKVAQHTLTLFSRDPGLTTWTRHADATPVTLKSEDSCLRSRDGVVCGQTDHFLTTGPSTGGTIDHIEATSQGLMRSPLFTADAEARILDFQVLETSAKMYGYVITAVAQGPDFRVDLHDFDGSAPRSLGLFTAPQLDTMRLHVTEDVTGDVPVQVHMSYLNQKTDTSFAILLARHIASSNPTTIDISPQLATLSSAEGVEVWHAPAQRGAGAFFALFPLADGNTRVEHLPYTASAEGPLVQPSSALLIAPIDTRRDGVLRGRWDGDWSSKPGTIAFPFTQSTGSFEVHGFVLADLRSTPPALSTVVTSSAPDTQLAPPRDDKKIWVVEHPDRKDELRLVTAHGNTLSREPIASQPLTLAPLDAPTSGTSLLESGIDLGAGQAVVFTRSGELTTGRTGTRLTINGMLQVIDQTTESGVAQARPITWRTPPSSSGRFEGEQLYIAPARRAAMPQYVYLGGTFTQKTGAVHHAIARIKTEALLFSGSDTLDVEKGEMTLYVLPEGMVPDPTQPTLASAYYGDEEVYLLAFPDIAKAVKSGDLRPSLVHYTMSASDTGIVTVTPKEEISLSALDTLVGEPGARLDQLHYLPPKVEGEAGVALMLAAGPGRPHKPLTITKNDLLPPVVTPLPGTESGEEVRVLDIDCADGEACAVRWIHRKNTMDMWSYESQRASFSEEITLVFSKIQWLSLTPSSVSDMPPMSDAFLGATSDVRLGSVPPKVDINGDGVPDQLLELKSDCVESSAMQSACGGWDAIAFGDGAGGELLYLNPSRTYKQLPDKYNMSY